MITLSKLLHLHHVLMWGWMLCVLLAQQAGFIHFALVDHALIQTDQGGIHYAHKAHTHTDHGNDRHYCADHSGLEHDHPCSLAPITSFTLPFKAPQSDGILPLGAQLLPIIAEQPAYKQAPIAYAPKQSPPYTRIRS